MVVSRGDLDGATDLRNSSRFGSVLLCAVSELAEVVVTPAQHVSSPQNASVRHADTDLLDAVDAALAG
jgi:hypothetical protein